MRRYVEGGYCVSGLTGHNSQGVDGESTTVIELYNRAYPTPIYAMSNMNLSRRRRNATEPQPPNLRTQLRTTAKTMMTKTMERIKSKQHAFPLACF